MPQEVHADGVEAFFDIVHLVVSRSKVGHHGKWQVGGRLHPATLVHLQGGRLAWQGGARDQHSPHRFTVHLLITIIVKCTIISSLRAVVTTVYFTATLGTVVSIHLADVRNGSSQVIERICT